MQLYLIHSIANSSHKDVQVDQMDSRENLVRNQKVKEIMLDQKGVDQNVKLLQNKNSIQSSNHVR